MKWTWIFLALTSGAFLPVQAGLNTKLGKSIDSPMHASLVSFIVGAFVVLLFVSFTKQPVSWSGIKTVSPYVWMAGTLGAFYVTVIILAFPRIGPALTFGLVVTGQMIISVVLDHFNILVAQQHSINFRRIIGIILIIAGVIIVRKF